MTKHLTLVLIVLLYSLPGVIEAQSRSVNILDYSTILVCQNQRFVNNKTSNLNAANNNNSQLTEFSASTGGVFTENTFNFDETTESHFTAKNILMIILIFIIGLVVGAFGVYYYSKQKVYSILKEERVYYLDYPPLKNEKSIFHYITLFHVLKRRKDTYKRLNHELRKDMEILEAKNSKSK